MLISVDRYRFVDAFALACKEFHAVVDLCYDGHISLEEMLGASILMREKIEQIEKELENEIEIANSSVGKSSRSKSSVAVCAGTRKFLRQISLYIRNGNAGITVLRHG